MYTILHLFAVDNYQECLTLAPPLQDQMLPLTILYLDYKSNVLLKDSHGYENAIFIELMNVNLGDVMSYW